MKQLAPPVLSILALLGVSDATHAQEALPRARISSVEEMQQEWANLKAQGVSVEALLAEFSLNPNFYVFAVQTELRARGLYSLAPSGQLTQATISALGVHCRAAEIADICWRGPMLSDAQHAIAETLLAAPESATIDAPEDVGFDATPEWSLEDEPGLTHTIRMDGDAVEITYIGTAEDAGYLNILPRSPCDNDCTAASGQVWRSTVTAQVAGSSPPVVTLRAALLNQAGRYVGELHKGEVLPPTDHAVFYARNGTVQDDAASVRQYFQITFVRGEEIDLLLRVHNPQLFMTSEN